MKKELNIMEMMLPLNNTHAQEFHKQYINNPYCKGIWELHELVNRGETN